MRTIKLVLVLVILSSIFLSGKAIPALAAGYNAVNYAVFAAWHKQFQPRGVVVQFPPRAVAAQLIKRKRAEVILYMLPKVRKHEDINKTMADMEHLERLRRTIESNL